MSCAESWSSRSLIHVRLPNFKSTHCRDKTVKRSLIRVRDCVSENHVKGVLRSSVAALERPEYGVTAPHGLARQAANTIGAGKSGAPRLVHITTECRIAPRNQNRAGRLPLDAADGRSIGHCGPH